MFYSQKAKKDADKTYIIKKIKMKLFNTYILILIIIFSNSILFVDEKFVSRQIF